VRGSPPWRRSPARPQGGDAGTSTSLHAKAAGTGGPATGPATAGSLSLQSELGWSRATTAAHGDHRNPGTAAAGRGRHQEGAPRGDAGPHGPRAVGSRHSVWFGTAQDGAWCAHLCASPDRHQSPVPDRPVANLVSGHPGALTSPVSKVASESALATTVAGTSDPSRARRRRAADRSGWERRPHRRDRCRQHRSRQQAVPGTARPDAATRAPDLARVTGHDPLLRIGGDRKRGVYAVAMAGAASEHPGLMPQ
jgi:hypothetical protein